MNIFHDPSGTIWIRVYIAQITQIPTLVTSSTGENRDYLFGNKSPSCFSPSHWKAPFTALPGRANSEGFALEASWRFQFQTDHVFAWRKSSGNVAKQWNIHDLRSIYLKNRDLISQSISILDYQELHTWQHFHSGVWRLIWNLQGC